MPEVLAFALSRLKQASLDYIVRPLKKEKN
jgi:hypothetical protein